MFVQLIDSLTICCSSTEHHLLYQSCLLWPLGCCFSDVNMAAHQGIHLTSFLMGDVLPFPQQTLTQYTYVVHGQGFGNYFENLTFKL